MKKTVLVFGLISGLISGLMLCIIPLFGDSIGFDKGMIIGYSSMILSLSLIFFGIKSYRDNVQNGVITFGKAFGVGILICLISCILYVLAWEVIYNNFMTDFSDKYMQYQIDQMKSTGATDAMIEATKTEAIKFKEMYQSPVFRMLITFTEPFPVGLLITLVSALVLKRKNTKIQTA